MKKLRYICVQPRLLYYAWQVEVMINNYLKYGIDPTQIDILVAWNPNDGTNTPEVINAWNKLAVQYEDVNFYYYQDSRQQPIYYISSIRPNVLKQHFAKYPHLSTEVFFYSDCDIVLTKAPDFDKYLKDDRWYLSDTNGYINSSYILSKGEDVYEKMCEIVGIHPSIPKKYNDHSGGAQYILKNVDATFWAKVERDCEQLFHQITQLSAEKKQQDPEYHELQIWCADMWAVLWNAWMRGVETLVVPGMNFAWATDQLHRWDEVPIYHNAGVTCSCGRQFFKAKYMSELPYSIELDKFNNTMCSYNYVKEIVETAEKSCLVTR